MMQKLFMPVERSHSETSALDKSSKDSMREVLNRQGSSGGGRVAQRNQKHARDLTMHTKPTKNAAKLNDLVL